MMEIIEYKNKKPDLQKFISFGFVPENGEYCYLQRIADGQLLLKLIFSEGGVLRAGVFDPAFGEEYVLHKVSASEGAFVGNVRTVYEQTLAQVLEKCFEDDALKTDQAKKLALYIFEKYGDVPEYPWQDENAIVRRKDNKKWYAAFLRISAKKLGLCSDKTVEVVNLKLPPDEIATIVDGKSCFPAYHMNKKTLDNGFV